MKYLLKIHEKIVELMANSPFVEKFLIAKYHNGEIWLDCIYCTILRMLMLGILLGLLIGWFVWK